MPPALPSTVPAVIAYLKTEIAAQIATDATPGDIYLCVGDPGTPDPNGIIQIVSQVSRNVEPFAAVHDGGQNAFYEKYAIIVKVDVVARGDTEEDIALPLVQRAWALVNYVEMAVRQDLSLGGLVVEGRPGQTTGGQAVWSEDLDGAMECAISYRIQVEAAI